MALKFAFCFLIALSGLFTIIYCDNELHETVTNFARKIFKAAVAKNLNENVIMSPYAIQRIIMVALQAARGPLYSQMQQALEVDCIGDVLADGLFKNYPEGFHYVDQIFHSSSTTLRIPFILLAKILFNVSPETVDFSNPRRVSRQINSFVEKSTTGMLKKYIKTTEIHNESSIYFINGVYFEGHWDTPFDKKNNRLGKFYNFGTEQVLTNNMYSVQYLNYGKLNDMDAHAVELPYRDAYEKMLIVLPKVKSDFRRVQEKVMKTDFPNILKRMKSQLVAISIPPFSIEYRSDLSKILPNIGMENLFATDVDLTNGFDTAPESMVPRLFHKAFFDFNEYGSVVDVPRSNKKTQGNNDNDLEQKSPDFFFLVEHPFLFFLHTNGTIHFVGSVQKIGIYDPSK